MGKNGIVYLVGAGPGRPDLITVRGLELLKAADCIVCDKLSSPALLAYARPDARALAAASIAAIGPADLIRPTSTGSASLRVI
jgi:siroheme synthase